MDHQEGAVAHQDLVAGHGDHGRSRGGDTHHLDGDLGGVLAGRQGRKAFDHVDLVLLHQVADAAIELLGDGARTGNDLFKVEAGFFAGQAVITKVIDLVEHFGRFQQGFRRNTAPVEADAAQQFTLDNGDLEAVLRGADGAFISAGAGTDNYEIISHVCNLTIIPKYTDFGKGKRPSPLIRRAQRRLSGQKSIASPMLCQHLDRVFDQSLEGRDELGADRTIDHAVIAGQGHGHDRGDGQCTILDDGTLITGAD